MAGSRLTLLKCESEKKRGNMTSAIELLVLAVGAVGGLRFVNVQRQLEVCESGNGGQNGKTWSIRDPD